MALPVPGRAPGTGKALLLHPFRGSRPRAATVTLDGTGKALLAHGLTGCECEPSYFLPKRTRRVVANSVAEAANIAPRTSAIRELEFIPVTPAG